MARVSYGAHACDTLLFSLDIEFYVRSLRTPAINRSRTLEALAHPLDMRTRRSCYLFSHQTLVAHFGYSLSTLLIYFRPTRDLTHGALACLSLERVHVRHPLGTSAYCFSTRRHYIQADCASFMLVTADGESGKSRVPIKFSPGVNPRRFPPGVPSRFCA